MAHGGIKSDDEESDVDYIFRNCVVRQVSQDEVNKIVSGEVELVKFTSPTSQKRVQVQSVGNPDTIIVKRPG